MKKRKYEDTIQNIKTNFLRVVAKLRHIQASHNMKPSLLLTLYSCYQFLRHSPSEHYVLS